MSKNFKNLISTWVQCTSITNRVLSSFDHFTAYYNCMTSFSVHNKSCLAQLTVLRLVTTVWVKTFKMSYLREWVHRYHKSCSQADLTVLRVITIVWTKTSKMSYISEFSAQVSQIVFSAHLTVLRLITTVWAKTSKMSYLREFSPQVSQIVFSIEFYGLLQLYDFRHIFEYDITNRVLKWFDRFTGYYKLYEHPWV